MIILICQTLVLSIIAGILYRMGGTSLGTKWRDMGLPTCMILFMILTGHIHWTLILCFGLMFGAQTTYFKKKGEDAKWWNWALCGLAFGLAMLPWTAAAGHWAGFGVRVLVVTVFTTVWSVVVGKVAWEEFGRGWGQIITLPLLFI